MITTHEQLAEAATIPVVGLPPDTVVERMPLADGGVFEVAVVAIPAADPAAHDAVIAELVGRAGSWVTAATPGGDPPLVVPLYGTAVVWSPRRAAALGPADRLAAMRSAASAAASVLARGYWRRGGGVPRSYTPCHATAGPVWRQGVAGPQTF